MRTLGKGGKGIFLFVRITTEDIAFALSIMDRKLPMDYRRINKGFWKALDEAHPVD
jgi:hypothetical protein